MPNWVWLEGNWKFLGLGIISAVALFFGSVTGFIDIIQQVLNVHPTIFQFVSFILVVFGAIGLFTVLFVGSRKPNPPQLPFYRLDSFDARVEKSVYELGQHIFYVATFTGLLRAGYYDAILVSPDQKTVSYVWDPNTLLSARHLQGRELHGEKKDYQSRWSSWIPLDCPVGVWTAHIGIYDCLPLDWPTAARVRIYLNWLLRRLIKKDVRFLARPARPCIDQKTV